MFSGGIASWATARRVAEKHGTGGLVLLFADTSMEDPDLYRFLKQAAANVGGELVRLADGRTPWDVFFDERFLGNHRIDPCSKILKRQLLRRWLEAECDPATTTVYLGLDWNEGHRLERAGRYWKPWRVEAPLMDPPLLDRPELRGLLEAQGIRQPALYELGFPHNNCGGFCIKAGQAHFRLLLRARPETYAYHERREQELREYLGRDVAILTDRSGGRSGADRRPLTLREFRERLEAEGDGQCDMFDWGGCGCMDNADDEEGGR